MHSVLDTALACVVGAVDPATGPSGVTLHRSTAASRARLQNLVFDFMSSIPSGVRIEALTDAAAIEIEVEMTRPLMPGQTSPGSRFDLVLDGVLQPSGAAVEETLLLIDQAAGTMEFLRADPAVLRFELGGGGVERRVEIWFPSAPSLTLRDVRVPEGTTLRPAPAAGPLWVHHGSSISQCSEVDRPTGTWPATVARGAGRSLLNLSLGGECQLDQFVARLIRDTPAAAISLELGINVLNVDSMRERTFVSAVHGFLDTIREGHPATPILVVSPIVCPLAEDHPGPTLVSPDLPLRVRVVDRPAELAVGSLTLTRIRELLHAVVEQRRTEGDQNLHLLDGQELFGPDDVDHLPDGLHPDAEGYARMADRFAPVAFGPQGVLA